MGVLGGLVVLDQDLLLVAALHPDLFDKDLGSLVRCKEDIVVGGVALLGEHGGNQMSPEMVTAAGCDMDGSAHLLVLNVASADRKKLGAETEFTEFASDWIGDQLGIVSGDGGGISLDELGLYDTATGYGHQSERSILVLVGERSLRTLGDEVDLSGGKIRDIRLVTAAEAMALLGLLAVKNEAESVVLIFAAELDLYPVGVGHSKTKFLGLDTDLVVINSESARENDLVYSVQGRSTEAVLLGKGGQRGSC